MHIPILNCDRVSPLKRAEALCTVHGEIEAELMDKAKLLFWSSLEWLKSRVDPMVHKSINTDPMVHNFFFFCTYRYEVTCYYQETTWWKAWEFVVNKP